MTLTGSGMSVNRDTARHMVQHEGETFYFCCAGCKDKFDKQPDKYGSVPKVWTQFEQSGASAKRCLGVDINILLVTTKAQ